MKEKSDVGFGGSVSGLWLGRLPGCGDGSKPVQTDREKQGSQKGVFEQIKQKGWEPDCLVSENGKRLLEGGVRKVIVRYPEY